MNSKTASAALFVFWFTALAGSAHAEYAYDCKVDWSCHGPNLCENSDMELSLAFSGDYVGLEFGDGKVTDLYKVDGEAENGAFYTGFDNEGNFTVVSLNFTVMSATDSGRMFISKHRLPGSENIFTNEGGLSSAYLTCKWRF